MAGWIKLHRDFISWEWFDKPEMVQIYIYLLMSANHTPQKWQGREIKRGEVVTSVGKIAVATGLSVQTIRTCIARLKSTGEITSESTSRYTIIKVCEYDTYNNEGETSNKSSNKVPNKRTTIKQQTANKRLTTNKNDKNDKNNNTHTQYSCLEIFTHTHEAHVHTPEQMCAVASAIREQVQRGELPEYKSIDEVAKGMIWLYAEYPELMQRFKRPCTRQDFQTISQMCEVEDVKGIVEALANKLSGDKPLNSFLATFKQWAALDYRIKDKARLGNPRYSKLS